MQVRTNHFFLSAMIVSFAFYTGAAHGTQPPIKRHRKFRIIGYLQTFNIVRGEGKTFDFSRINYLNIAFVNPDSTGRFEPIPGLDTTVLRAHQNQVKVLASIGGGANPPYYRHLTTVEKQGVFIDSLMNFVVKNNLDGVDVDLEDSLIDPHYDALVTTLKAALRAKGKLMTAAISTAYKTQYTDHSLAQMDFMSIMSYDLTGPWNVSKPGPHSPYNMAVEDLEYFHKQRKIAKNKLNVGLPFYGYGFGNNVVKEYGYKDVISQFPQNNHLDTAAAPEGSIIYYNGINTIKAKTEFALKKCGGVMIWELSADALADESLLKVIDDTVYGH